MALTELQKMGTVVLSHFRKMYDIHFNPSPMDVTIPRGSIDENGNLVDVVVKNRAKERAEFDSWKVESQGKHFGLSSSSKHNEPKQVKISLFGRPNYNSERRKKIRISIPRSNENLILFVHEQTAEYNTTTSCEAHYILNFKQSGTNTMSLVQNQTNILFGASVMTITPTIIDNNNVEISFENSASYFVSEVNIKLICTTGINSIMEVAGV